MKKHLFPGKLYSKSEEWGIRFIKISFIWQLIVAALLIVSLDALGRNVIRAANELVVFEDISAEAGFDVIQSNTGLGWADYDNDGDEDIYVGRHGYIGAMYRNDGNNVFTEVTSQVNMVYESDHHGFSWGDYDNDGWIDLYITTGRNSGGSSFFVNKGGTFSYNEAERAGILNDWGRGRQAQWADYNNDGHLDLFVGNGVAGIHQTRDSTLYRNNGDRTFTDVTQESNIFQGDVDTVGIAWADYNKDGHADVILTGRERNSVVLNKNNGDGTFTVSEEISFPNKFSGLATAWGDYDNDGDPDLVIGRGVDGHGEMLDLVDGRIEFAADVLDGRDDFKFTHTGDQLTLSLWRTAYDAHKSLIFIGWEGRPPDFLPKTSKLILDDDDPANQGKPSFKSGEDRGVFIWRKSNGEWNIHMSAPDRDKFFGIIESNGAIDKLVSLGFESYVSRTPDQNKLYRNDGETFTDVTDESGIGQLPPVSTQGLTWIDFDNDGDLDLYEVNQGNVDIGNEPNRLYRNNGDGTFTDVAAQVGLQAVTPGYGSCSAWADYDQNGFLDVFVITNWWVGPLAGPEKLYRNQGNDNNWLRLKLVGVQSTRQGVGAKVELQTASGLQYRDTNISSGSECQDSSIVHFGLGRLDRVDRLKITWPSGVVDIFDNVASNQLLTIREGSSTIAISLNTDQPISARPDSQVTLDYTLTNMGDSTDSFTVTAVSALPGWPVTVAPAEIESLKPHESAAFEVTVQVPATALDETEVAINVTVKSQTNNMVEANVTDIIKVVSTLLTDPSDTIYLPAVLSN